MKRVLCGATLLMMAMPHLTFAYPTKATTLKIALLDNFTLEKYAQIYKNSYYAGIETAILAAKKQHVAIQFKNFTYGNDPLGVLDAIPTVKAWHPDVIIGPHYSNQFLLLKNYFHHVLVLSPYASDESISHMPSNFYSLALPDSDMARTNYIFIKKYFPNRSIYNISQLDCKDCIDTTKNLDAIYKRKNKSDLSSDANYLGDHIDTIDMKKLMKGYKKNSVIVLQPLNDLDANKLTVRITQFLKEKNLVFLYNVDNWGNNKNFQTIVDNANISSHIFRVTPWIINPHSEKYQTFVKYYREKFNTTPNNAVSYMTYRCIMSVVSALQKFLVPAKSTTKETVLASYSAALKSDKNWYRITKYAIFQHDHSHDVLLGVITTHDHT